MHQLLLAPSFHYFLCSFSWLLSHRASVHWEKMDLIKERKKLDFLGVCIFYVENQTWNGFGETHWAFRQGHTCKRWFSLKKKKNFEFVNAQNAKQECSRSLFSCPELYLQNQSIFQLRKTFCMKNIDLCIVNNAFSYLSWLPHLSDETKSSSSPCSWWSAPQSQCQ